MDMHGAGMDGEDDDEDDEPEAKPKKQNKKKGGDAEGSEEQKQECKQQWLLIIISSPHFFLKGSLSLSFWFGYFYPESFSFYFNCLLIS